MCLAIPGEVLSIEGDDPLLRKGRVSFGGMVKEVSLALVPEAAEGKYVMVHAGIAIAVIDEDAAQEVFDALEQLGALEELEEAGG
jgi:hydrogenase expression/formation protein HypC